MKATKTRIAIAKMAKQQASDLGDDFRLVPHKGIDLDFGVRIVGCDADRAAVVGNALADRLGGVFRQAAGFACVWF